jgi:hypothetical protein
MIYRLKQLGDRLFSREIDRQVAESHVLAPITNQFTYLGLPKSVRAGQIAPTPFDVELALISNKDSAVFPEHRLYGSANKVLVDSLIQRPTINE